MTETTTIDADVLRAWIGREEYASDLVTVDLVRKYLATFDFPDARLALDANTDALRTDPDPREGDLAPRFIHFCLTTPVAPMAGLGRDGHPAKGGFLPPVPLPRRMWAGGELRFTGDIRVGDTVRRLSRIADIAVKQGRTGTLCFVTVAHTISVNGRIVVGERQDIVYRADEAGAKPKASPPAAPLGEERCTILPTPTLLFRYSALTFNGHRIHYDRPYATEVEGYPGLVVHGPLQAVLLYYFAAGLRARSPDRYAYRGLSPAFDGAELHFNATPEADGRLRLWTACDGSPVAMSGEAEWL